MGFRKQGQDFPTGFPPPAPVPFESVTPNPKLKLLEQVPEVAEGVKVNPSSLAAGVAVEELPREAFGVRPACWRCQRPRVGRTRACPAVASVRRRSSSTHSKRFAFGCVCSSALMAGFGSYDRPNQPRRDGR